MLTSLTRAMPRVIGAYVTMIGAVEALMSTQPWRGLSEMTGPWAEVIGSSTARATDLFPYSRPSIDGVRLIILESSLDTHSHK